MINRWRSPRWCLAGTIIHDVSRISTDSISKAINKDSFKNQHPTTPLRTLEFFRKALDDFVSMAHSLCRDETLALVTQILSCFYNRERDAGEKRVSHLGAWGLRQMHSSPQICEWNHMVLWVGGGGTDWVIWGWFADYDRSWSSPFWGQKHAHILGLLVFIHLSDSRALRISERGGQ